MVESRSKRKTVKDSVEMKPYINAVLECRLTRVVKPISVGHFSCLMTATHEEDLVGILTFVCEKEEDRE